MRRYLAILASLALVLLLAQPALANKLARATENITFLDCGSTETTDGIAYLFAEEHVFNGESSLFADLLFWAGSPGPEDPPTLAGVATTGTLDATGASLTVDLVDPDGVAAGQATVDATFSPDGDPIPFSFHVRNGNRWHDEVGFDQSLVVSGTLSIGGAAFDLGACFALHTEATITDTAPNAFVSRDEFQDLFCTVVAGDRTIFIGGFSFEGNVDLVVSVDPDGVFGEAGFTWASERGGGFALSGNMDASDIDGNPAGSIAFDLQLTPSGPPIDQVLPRRTGWEKNTFQAYDVTGSVQVEALGLDVPITDCTAVFDSFRQVVTNQQGPKAPTPPNDGPDGAIAVHRGSAIALRTGGASDGEATTSCLEGRVTVPFARTVWYTFVGDGSPVTIDTAGSDFDTVVAVYDMEDLGGGPELVEVACADDVFFDIGKSIQAAVTVDTQAGVTYWIQVGGWNNEWGRLRMTVS